MSKAGAKIGMSGFKDAWAPKGFLLVASNSVQERMREGKRGRRDPVGRRCFAFGRIR